MSSPSSFTSAKCVLVIGATSGIGKDLALAIHASPSKPTVILSGRRQARLDEALKVGSKAGTDRLYAKQVDVTASIPQVKAFVDSVIAEFPELDAVIFASGIQHQVNFKKPDQVTLDQLLAEVSTNYTSILAMITMFLPHFLKLHERGLPSFIVPVTSGLAFRPMPSVPNYCATKAALHSLCITLRTQLRNTKVEVIEIAPPLVESELHDHQGNTEALAKFWMPLSEFTPQVMAALDNGNQDIPIGTSAQAYEQHEKGKQETSDKMYARMGGV